MRTWYETVRTRPAIHLRASISAVILAGGRSRRMGRDKASLQFRGQPFLQRSCQLALALSDDVYVVTSKTARHEPIIPEGCHVIRDSQENQGPLLAFAQALPRVRREWVFLLAVDLPLLDREEIKTWMAQLPQVRANVIALVPKREEVWHCLCGFYRATCLSSLEKFIASGGRSFQEWLQLSPVATISLSNPQSLFNCNTPQDLGEAEHLQEKRNAEFTTDERE